MSRKIKFPFIFLLSFLFLFLSVFNNFISNVSAASDYNFIILGKYSKTLNIGDEFLLTAFTSNGKKPSFSSSNSKIASVSSNGKVTAKKAGNASIAVKIKNAEATCRITVNKTVIRLNKKTHSMENGYSFCLRASVSTGHEVTWKSNKKSVASVNEKGVVTAKKPGSATITATADKTSATCKITVLTPKVTLNRTKASCYRGQTITLSVASTSKSRPKWKSSKKSVATVDENGKVTAHKHGTAVITVTVDNVRKTCLLTVKKPKITFQPDTLTLKPGAFFTPSVTVSSGNKPVFSSSNINIADVDENGKIHARQPGKAYIYAKEDGAKASLILTVR